jgi:NADPH2:quinone reductase
MTLAVRIHEHGAPEVLRIERVNVPPPGAGDVLIAQSAIGLNYIDTYHRSGLYPVALPGIIGMEAAGVVESVGAGVTAFKPGDRVAYASGPLGAYAARRVMPAGRVVKLPDRIDLTHAAAVMVKGMTAEYLLRRTYPVKPGDIILVHAAAGGVGQILCQWGRYLGATVIATAGGAEKCRIALASGAHHAIDYRTESFALRVRELTNGLGVHAVYDGVGADTFMGSLDCLRPRGYMVSYGNASGPVPAFEPRILATKGSLFLTRPTLTDYTATDADYQASAQTLFDAMAAGAFSAAAAKTYPLSEAVQAHRDLESRVTTGSVVMVP